MLGPLFLPPAPALALSFRTARSLRGEESPFGITNYIYDALGRRIAADVDGQATYFVYGAGLDVLEERDGAATVLARYTYGAGLDEPLMMERAGSVHTYHRDALGNITGLTDAGGAPMEQYRYDAFGAPAFFDGAGSPLAASAIGNPYLFTARRFDAEWGGYDHRARAYYPALGRFLQPDPLGYAAGSLNLYQYANDSPLRFTDPLGLDEIPDSGPVAPAQPEYWDPVVPGTLPNCSPKPAGPEAKSGTQPCEKPATSPPSQAPDSMPGQEDLSKLATALLDPQGQNYVKAQQALAEAEKELQRATAEREKLLQQGAREAGQLAEELQAYADKLHPKLFFQEEVMGRLEKAIRQLKAKARAYQAALDRERRARQAVDWQEAVIESMSRPRTIGIKPGPCLPQEHRNAPAPAQPPPDPYRVSIEEVIE
jgi:RHS repeat-associated protein